MRDIIASDDGRQAAVVPTVEEERTLMCHPTSRGSARNDAIVLHLPDGDRRLPQVVAASGARYEDASTYDEVTAQTAPDGTLTFGGTRAADTIRVTLRQQSCQDSTSGDGFPITVEVEVNGQRRQGCGTTLERER